MAERLDGALVLVCDDMGDVGRAIGGLLERAGAEVALSEHPSDALEALSEDPESWSLLVTDYDMPGMTGAELAAAARRTAPGLAVLLCSAWADSLGDAGPVDAVMPKPVTRARLAEAVMRALAARDARLAHLDVGAPGASSDAADRAEP